MRLNIKLNLARFRLLNFRRMNENKIFSHSCRFDANGMRR
ncbi:hypothetical protein CAMSH0001_0265 [Campylobacter showae RM3277]|uniref:Uncharacterized protein n=1 Tax=Campylobacter showae RM3277 TaxID=553219 RepID=C6RIB3_9BACT|nr:hypothetical protein CAMSH0001_0265 [Campylobacter showae RM3277]